MNKHIIDFELRETENTSHQNENAEVKVYLTRYIGCLKNAAEAVLGLTVTLAEAKSQLNNVDFSILCDEVGKHLEAEYSFPVSEMMEFQKVLKADDTSVKGQEEYNE